MHFTLWASAREPVGAHCEITWDSFLAFVASPATAPAKDQLEGWSPALFRENRRGRAFVEKVSCLVLDDDGSGQSTDELAARWSGCAGAVHTSFSHEAGAPKHRIVLRLSRDVTADEYDRLWPRIAAGHGLDPAPKDPSRLWYVPAIGPGGYEWRELKGAALDVDSALDLPDPKPYQKTLAAIERVPASAGAEGLVGRRAAMAAALAAAWPGTGRRHEAQLALAGALRAEGWDEAEAVDFLTAVAGERAKRQATCRHTWGRPADAPTTGWSRLKSLVDPVVVDAARGALGRGAGWEQRLEKRLVEALPAPAPSNDEGFAFRVGGLDAPLPPLRWLVDGLIGVGDVGMLVAHGGSLKTWTALSLALAISTGRPWLGRYAVKLGRVAILDWESGEYELDRRLKLLGARDAEIGGRLLRSSYSTMRLLDPESWIKLAEKRLDLVIVDSYAAAAPELDENDSRAHVLLQHAGRFSEATTCAVKFIHHRRKEENGDKRISVRGNSSLFAACDRIFGFEDTEWEPEQGLVRSTIRSLKDGAGRAPLPFRVELSDAGLREIELATEQPQEDDGERGGSTYEQNEATVLEILSKSPSGVAKNDLVQMLKGKRQNKFELLLRMTLSGQIIEFSDASTGVRRTMIHKR